MFDMTPFHDGFDLEMDTDLLNVDRCVDRIREFLEKRKAQDHFFALSLLTREALNNAMIHGNGQDPAKRVRFRLRALQDGFDLEVGDEGPGFDWRSRVMASSDVEDVRGRGHEIYRNYASAVRYNERGNVVTLEYRGEAC
jgi:serine/threonine-protein kinase RsbW